MKRVFIFLVFGVLVLSMFLMSSPKVEAATQVNFNDPDHDSYIYSQQPETNFDQSSQGLAVDDDAYGTYYSYVWWNISSIPTGSNILNATMRLYAWDVDSNVTLSAQRLTGTWNQTTITWNIAPGASGGAVNIQTGTTDGVWLNWTITSIVRNWVVDELANYGIRIIPSPNQNSQTRFRASDGYLNSDPDYFPRIFVNYTAPAGQASVTTDAATNITYENATLNGNLTVTGGPITTSNETWDDFDRANSASLGTLSGGGTWQESESGVQALAIQANYLETRSAYLGVAVYGLAYPDNDFDDDQFARILFYSFSANATGGPAARLSGTYDNATGYVLVMNRTASVNNITLVKWENKSLNEWGTVLAGPYAGITTDEPLEIRAFGTNISIWINGTWIDSVTDSDISTGSPGMVALPFAQASTRFIQWNDVELGNVTQETTDVSVYFEYGTDEDALSGITSQQVFDIVTEFNNTITNLAIRTTYYFRAVAVNDFGTVYGDTLSFTTSVKYTESRALGIVIFWGFVIAIFGVISIFMWNYFATIFAPNKRIGGGR